MESQQDDMECCCVSLAVSESAIFDAYLSSLMSGRFLFALAHVIVRGRSPVTSHRRMVESPFLTVLSDSVTVTLGGTEDRKKKKKKCRLDLYKHPQ